MEIRNFADVKVYVNTEDILKSNVVYKITFPNGKVYIGQTVQKLKNRLRSHCNRAFNIKDSQFNCYKSNAIRKYMTFEVEVLYQGDELDYNEIYYIKEYNSSNKDFGYNLDSGGNLNKQHSEETKQKISEAHKGRKNIYAYKAVIVTELSTGIETRFDSITNAAKYYQIGITSLSDVLSGRRETFKNKQYIVHYE